MPSGFDSAWCRVSLARRAKRSRALTAWRWVTVQALIPVRRPIGARMGRSAHPGREHDPALSAYACGLTLAASPAFWPTPNPAHGSRMVTSIAGRFFPLPFIRGKVWDVLPLHRPKRRPFRFTPPSPAPDGSKENCNGTRPPGSRRRRHHLVIPGEMAARIDRLPMSWMAWEISPDHRGGLGVSGLRPTGSPRGCTRSYGFPNHALISHFDYSVLYALQTGISILLGGYFFGWLADRIRQRKALILAAALAAVFIWPFAYVTNSLGCLSCRSATLSGSPGSWPSTSCT